VDLRDELSRAATKHPKEMPNPRAPGLPHSGWGLGLGLGVRAHSGQGIGLGLGVPGLRGMVPFAGEVELVHDAIDLAAVGVVGLQQRRLRLGQGSRLA